jgi:hypothetical protein
MNCILPGNSSEDGVVLVRFQKGRKSTGKHYSIQKTEKSWYGHVSIVQVSDYALNKVGKKNSEESSPETEGGEAAMTPHLPNSLV